MNTEKIATRIKQTGRGGIDTFVPCETQVIKTFYSNNMNTLTTKQGIGTKVQLCTMMFMQYMLSAVWWVPLAAYLSHTLKLEVYQVSLVLSAMAIGAMASSFIGAIADRYFAAEKILAVLNILTGAFLLLAPSRHHLFLLWHVSCWPCFAICRHRA